MNRDFRIPPSNKAALTPPDALARRLKELIGSSFPLTGKSRTDGSNVRKLVAKTLEQYPLPPLSPPDFYRIVPLKKKGVPSILREYLDTYIVTTGTSYNLQVWNRNPATDSVQVEYVNGEQLSAKDVRFVFVRVSSDTGHIKSILVLTPEYIESKFGRFGVPTIKHQLIITNNARTVIHTSTPPMIFYTDTPTVSSMVTNLYTAPQDSMHDPPRVGHLLSIEVLRDRIIPQLLGVTLNAAATKNRGQALELLVAQHIGYLPGEKDLLAAGYPDIRNQALEVKVQDSPTVDLGRMSPQFKVEAKSYSGPRNLDSESGLKT